MWTYWNWMVQVCELRGSLGPFSAGSHVCLGSLQVFLSKDMQQLLVQDKQQWKDRFMVTNHDVSACFYEIHKVNKNYLEKTLHQSNKRY